MKQMALAITALAVLTAHPVLAQETESNLLVLLGKEVPGPSMEGCKTALEQGKIVKTDENGELHIAFQGYYFVIKVDQTRLECRLYRHVFSN